MHKATLLLACVAFVGLANAFEVKRCDNNQAIELVELKISSCPEKTGDACHMKLHDTITFDVRFKTTQSYHGQSYYTTMDLKDHNTGHWRRAFTHEACDHQGLKCPIEARRESYFQEHMKLDENMVSTSYRIGLMDPDHGQLLCLQIPAKVDRTEGTWDNYEHI